MPAGYKDLESGSFAAKPLTNEAFGTFFITLALLSGVSGWGALAVGGMLGFFSWFESAGQYNAAVTLSNCVGKNASMGLVAGVMCIVAQIVGAALAVAFTGLFQDGSASVPDGSLASGLSDALLTIVLLYTFAKNNNGLDLGLAYFSGLSAFPSALGANASAAVGVVVGNLLLGNGLAIGMDLVWAAGAPLAAGAAFPFLADLLTKIPRGGEALGTFFFATLSFSIGFDNAFAIGTSLHTVSNIFPGTYNPALTLAAWAKGGFNMSVVADPVLDIVAQVVGTALSAILLTGVLGGSAAVPSAVSLGPAAAIEGLFALVLALTYLSKDASTLTKGLAYYAAVTACASSYNTAFGLGLYVAGLGGFGEGALALTALVDPLVAGVAAGVLDGKLSDLNELLGTFLLFVFVGSTTDALALGAAFVTLHTVYAGATLNPALTYAQGGVNVNAFLRQFGGAALGGLVATYAGVGGGAATSDGGLSDGGRSIVAEALLAALLVKTYATNGNDHTSNGLSYFALLAALGGAAGSLANPALVLGDWLGGGLLGDGFDFGVDALLGLAGHLGAPLLGAALAGHLFALPSKLMLDKASLSSDEFFGGFLAVLAAAGVAGSDAASTDLAYGVVLMAIYNIVTTKTDIFPLVSAYRTLGSGDPASGAVEFLKRLAAQTLGAVLAGLAAGWLFASDGRRALGDALPAVEGAGHPAARRLGIDLPDGLLNGLLLGLLVAYGFDYCKNTLHLGVTFFVATSVFGGVELNGASSLATSLVGLVTGGGAGFATDADWWAAFLAPVVGGILAGRLAGLLGK